MALPGVQIRSRPVDVWRDAPEKFLPINSWLDIAPLPKYLACIAQRRSSPAQIAERCDLGSREEREIRRAFSHQRTDYNLYEGWELVGYPESFPAAS